MNAVPAGLLVLLTWLGWAGSLSGIGLVSQRMFCRGCRPLMSPWRFATAGWIGLGLVTVLALTVQIFTGIGAPATRVAAWLLLVAGWVLLILAIVRVRASLGRRVRSLRVTDWLTMLVLAAGVLLAAFWATGAPTNYDTGLYHAQSIWYSRDFGAIPGVANLHDRLGFNSSMWPMSALLGLGLWNGQEFRLMGGVLIVLAASDVMTRLMTRRLRGSAGTLLFIAGLVLTLAVIAQYPGRLIASSAQDTAALVLALAAISALLDAAMRGGSWRLALGISTILSLQVALMRPLGWVFVAGVVAATSILAWRRLGRQEAVNLLLPAWMLTGVGLAVMLVRDTILSGWLLFPLSVLPMPVAWRMADPVSTARDITGWARTPFQDVDITLASNDWFMPWLQRLFIDWATPVLLVLIATGVVLLLLVPPARHILGRRWRAVVLVEGPVLLTLGLWFVNAPDPRFAWGFIIGVGLIPLCVLITGIGWERAWKVAWAAAYGVLLVVAVARGSLAAMSWGLTSMPSVAVRTEQLDDGTPIKVPTAGDQCWDVYPMCAPEYVSRSVQLRGSSIDAGFTPSKSVS